MPALVVPRGQMKIQPARHELPEPAGKLGSAPRQIIAARLSVELFRPRPIPLLCDRHGPSHRAAYPHRHRTSCSSPQAHAETRARPARHEMRRQMTGDCVQAHAQRALLLDIGKQSFQRLAHRGIWRRFAENLRIDREQTPRLVIGGATEHHAIDVIEMRPSPPRYSRCRR